MSFRESLPNIFAAFLNGCVDCALWSSSIGEDFAQWWQDNKGDDMPVPDTSMQSFGFTADNLTAQAMRSLVNDCEQFCEHEAADLDTYTNTRDWSEAGHDFWLSRNGHGAGFWDRGLGKLGARLNQAAKACGTCDLYVGDDERIHVH